MKLLGFIAASLALAVGLASLSANEQANTVQEKQGNPGRSRSQNQSAASQPPEGGLSLGGFVDAWSLRQTAETAAGQPPALSEEEQRDRRVAAFMARMLPSEAASPALRPGDRAGLRSGDRVAARKTRTPPERNTEQAAADRVRAEQVTLRVQRFHALMEQRLAQAETNQNLPRAMPAATAGMRPGDSVGARAGDLASLQRKHP